MIDIEENQNVIYATAKGKLEDEDYKRVMPLIEYKAERYDRIYWYFELKDFKGWSPSALWKDLEVGLQVRDKLGKVAIVGEKKWQEWMTEMMKPFTSAEVSFFTHDHRDDAKKWVAAM